MNDASMKRRARELRRNMTPHERILWACLRKRQIGFFQFYRQRPIQGYIVDFYCPAADLVIELDGWQHSLPEAKAYDAVRTQVLNACGLCVLRFPNQRIESDLAGVIHEIQNVLSPFLEQGDSIPPGLPSKEGRRKAIPRQFPLS